MKKVLCLLLALTLSIGLCGCGSFSSLMEEYLPDVGDFLDGSNLLGGGQKEEVSQLPADDSSNHAQLPSGNDFPAVEAIKIPSFVEEPLLEAMKWLEEAGITPKIQYVYSDEVEKDLVISQSIPAGTEISPENEVLLMVSKGPQSMPCPYEYSQKLTVSAAKGATNATATLYVWGMNGWEQVAVYSAVVGKNGIGAAAEGSRRTPQGIHKLGVVLTQKSVDTDLQVYTVSGNTGVVDDKNSAYYNIIMEKSQVPSGTSFDQIGKSLTNGTTYATIFIEHNGDGFSSEGVVPGKGSAIGVRGQYGTLKATYGDVDISYRDMMDLLSRLEADRNPVIEIVVQ